MSLGPNSLEECPSRGARVRHAAHGRLCAQCNPEDAPFIHAAEIRAGRIGQGFSQRELATRAGVTVHVVGAVESLAARTRGRLAPVPDGAA